jgi:phage head maturation protease
VSPVTYPAYDGTDVAMRGGFDPSLEQRIREMDRPHKVPAAKREEIRRWLATHGM